MANHVQNYITVEGNDTVIQKFADAVADNTVGREIKGFNSEETYTIQEHVCIDELSFMPKYDEDDNYNWYCNNVGAKWAHIEDGSYDYINIVSAWSPVSEFCGKLIEYLGQFDKNVLIRHQYEDEFRNFFGVQILWVDDDGTAEYDHYEMEDDDYLQECLEKFPKWEDEDYDIWDYDEELDCYPSEVMDDFVFQWMDQQWEDLVSPFRHREES